MRIGVARSIAGVSSVGVVGLVLLLSACQQPTSDPAKGAMLFDAVLDGNQRDCALMEEDKLGIGEEEAGKKCRCAFDRMKVSLSPTEKDQIATQAVAIMNHTEVHDFSPAADDALERAKKDAYNACGAVMN